MGYDLAELMAELDAVPVDYRYMASDIWRIPYGKAYRIFEGRMVKHKLQALKSGQRMHIHT
jgi:hypothetical protein